MTAPIAATAVAERPLTWSRALASAAALWVLLDAAVLIGTFPYWPRTQARWALLLGAGPAMLLSLAGLLELAIVSRLRGSSSNRPAARRVAAALPVLAVAVAVALAAWWTLRVEGP